MPNRSAAFDRHGARRRFRFIAAGTKGSINRPLVSGEFNRWPSMSLERPERAQPTNVGRRDHAAPHPLNAMVSGEVPELAPFLSAQLRRDAIPRGS